MSTWEEIRWCTFCLALYLFILAKIVCCVEGVEIKDHHYHGDGHEHEHQCH